MEDYKTTVHNLYDRKFEHRFFVLLGNFVVHYSFPFTLYGEDFGGKYLKFTKGHLLGFPEWKYVKSGLEKMNGETDIRPYIKPMNVNLAVLFLVLVYHLLKEIVDAYKEISDFIIKHRIKSPAIVKFNSIEEFKKGNIILVPMDFKDLQNAFDDVKNHPSINITINDITPDWFKE